jgi:hypothetical protein
MLIFSTSCKSNDVKRYEDARHRVGVAAEMLCPDVTLGIQTTGLFADFFLDMVGSEEEDLDDIISHDVFIGAEGLCEVLKRLKREEADAT